MCVIIHQPRGKQIPEAHLAEANRCNRDGWGVAARAADGSISILRGFDTNKLLEAYTTLNGEGNEVVVHCRIATSGTRDLDMTHPFECGPNAYLFHNGIFNIRLTEKGKSDTWHLAEYIKTFVDNEPGLLHSPFFARVMEQWFTDTYSASSKGVILATDTTIIINEKGGVERNGVWYSNHSAFPIVRHSRYDSTYFASLDEDWQQYRRNIKRSRRSRNGYRESGSDITWIRGKGYRTEDLRTGVAGSHLPNTYVYDSYRSYVNDKRSSPDYSCICGNTYDSSVNNFCPQCLESHPDYAHLFTGAGSGAVAVGARESDPPVGSDDTNGVGEGLVPTLSDGEAEDPTEELSPDLKAWKCQGSLCDGECLNKECIPRQIKEAAMEESAVC